MHQRDLRELGGLEASAEEPGLRTARHLRDREREQQQTDRDGVGDRRQPLEVSVVDHEERADHAAPEPHGEELATNGSA